MEDGPIMKPSPEAEHEPSSEAAADAEARGLTSLGWGRWGDPDKKDPQTGHTPVVAKTVNGKLVKVNDVEGGSESPESEWAPNQPDNSAVKQENPPMPYPASPSDKFPGSSPPMPPTPDGEEEDSYVGGQQPNVAEPEEPSEPKFKGGLEKLLSIAGGDPDKLRKALVAKYRNGSASAKKWLDKLDAYEAADREHVRQALGRIQARKMARQQNLRSKYAQQYPSPQI